MPPEFLAWTVLYIFIIQLSLTMLAYLKIKAKKGLLLYSFMFIQFVSVLWTLRALIYLIAASYIQDKMLFNAVLNFLSWKLGIFVGGFIALGWLIFCLNYVEWKYAGRKLTVSLLAAPVALSFLMALTNDFHGLFSDDSGPGILFWIHAAIGYAYTITAFTALIRYAVKQSGHERKRTVLLIVAYFIPFISDILNEVRMFVFHMSPLLGDFDSSPVCFSIGIALIAFIIYKYRFLNISTVAMGSIVDNLKQAVVIVDTNNGIISRNRSFTDTFPFKSQSGHNEDIACFGEYLGNRVGTGHGNLKTLKMINSTGCEAFNGELELAEPLRRYYDVVIYPILKNGTVFGRILSFDDITQLHDYASTVEELAVIRERDRFSRDVHDTLGHTMTVLITQLKVVSILFDSEPDNARKKVGEMIRVAREGLNELRRSISGLRSGRLEEDNPENALARLVSDFEAAGMKIDLTVNGTAAGMSFDGFQAVFRICQEALTNSLRHGRAENVAIVLNFTGERAKLLIKDDGCGCGTIKKGFGLTGMEERVKNLGGYIRYGSDGEKGFNIFAEIPGRSY